jgi:hypothetical protein
MNFLSDLTLADLQDLFNSAILSPSITGEGGGWREGALITNDELEHLFAYVFNNVGINQEPGPAGDPYQGLMPAMNPHPEGSGMNFDIFLRSLNDWSIIAQTHAVDNPDNKIRVNGVLISLSDALKRIGQAMKERAVVQREHELTIFPHDVESMQPYQSNGVTLYVNSGITSIISGAYAPASQEAQSDIDMREKKIREIMKSKKSPAEKQKEISELRNPNAAEDKPVDLKAMTVDILSNNEKVTEATNIEWLKNAEKDAKLRAMNEDKARLDRMREEHDKMMAEEKAKKSFADLGGAYVVQQLKEAIKTHGMRSHSMVQVKHYLDVKSKGGKWSGIQGVVRSYKHGIMQRGTKNFEKIVKMGKVKLSSLEESMMDRDKKAEDADVQKLRELVNDAEEQLELRKLQIKKLEAVFELERQKNETTLEKKKKDEDDKKKEEDAKKEAEQKEAEEKEAEEEEEDIRPVDPTIKGKIADRNFLEGDRIERQDDLRGHHTGTIQQVNVPSALSALTSYTYDIIYDDGNYEEGVHPDLIRLIPPKPVKIEKRPVDQEILRELQDAMELYGSDEKINSIGNSSFSEPEIKMIERQNDIFEEIINKARNNVKSGIGPEIFGPAVKKLQRRKEMITEGVKKKVEDAKKKAEDAKKKAEAEAAAKAKAEAEAEAKREAEEEEERIRVKEAFLNKVRVPDPGPDPGPAHAPPPVAPVSIQPNASAGREAFLKRLEQKAKDAKKEGGTRRKLKKRSKQKSRRAKYMRKKSKKRSKQKSRKTKYIRKKKSKKAKNQKRKTYKKK